jgi:hypothetical protein
VQTAAINAVSAAVPWHGRLQPFGLFASQSGLAVTATFAALRTRGQDAQL